MENVLRPLFRPPLASFGGHRHRVATDALLNLFGPTDSGFLFDNLAKQAYRDTDLTTLVSADGQAVAGLKDRSPGGNNWTQATAASQSTYKTGSPPYLSFDGGDSYARDGAIGKFTGDFAIYVAAEASWASGTAKALLTKSDTSYSAGQWPLFWCFDVLGNGSGRFVWNLTSGANGSASVTSASALNAGPHVLGVERSGSTIQYFVDGVASGASATSSVTLGNFTANMEMGRFWFGSSGYVEFLTGKIYRPGILIDRSFSADERATVVSNLGAGLL